MEYNADELSLKKTPAQEIKMRFLKIDMIRLSVTKKYNNKADYHLFLQRAITNNRSVING